MDDVLFGWAREVLLLCMEKDWTDRPLTFILTWWTVNEIAKRQRQRGERREEYVEMKIFKKSANHIAPLLPFEQPPNTTCKRLNSRLG